MNCIDLTSKRSKMLSYVAKHSKLLKTTKVIKLQWIATICHQNYQKCWVTSQNIQNIAKLRKCSNYNGLHRFDVKNIKPTQNYKSDHITMKLHRFDVKTIKSTQNYKRDQITINLHRFDVKTSKRSKLLCFVAKNFKTTQHYKSDQIRTDCIDLM